MGRYRNLMQDARIALRKALRHRSFSLAVVGCLALGMGVTSAVLSVVHPVLLDSSPFPEEHRLYQVAHYMRSREDPNLRYWITYLEYDELRRASEVVEGMAGFVVADLDIFEDGEPQRLSGAWMIPGSFSALGVRPVIGREINQEDLDAGRRTAMISEGLWATRYARSRDVLGRRIDVGGRLHTLVGVVPQRARYPGRADLWIIHLPDDLSERQRVATGNLTAVARLVPGRTLADLNPDLERVSLGLESAWPDFYTNEAMEAVSLKTMRVGLYEKPLLILLASAMLVLVIAVANAGNLLVARYQEAAGEGAVRRALGATHAHLVRQLLMDNALLVVVGTLAGLGLAGAGLPLLLEYAPVDNPAFDGVGLSSAVIGAASVGAALVVVVLSMLPMLGRRGGADLVLGRGRGSAGRGHRRVQRLFVSGQVAISLALLVAASLTLRSFRELSRLHPGFEAAGLATIKLSMPPTHAERHQSRVTFLTDVLERLRGLPDVEAAGAVQILPIADGEWGYGFSIEGQPPERAGETESASGRVVTPGFFRSMGIPFLEGRDFTGADQISDPWVVIVSRSLAERYWPGESAIGKGVKRGSYDDERPWMRVVGVVGDVRGSQNLATPPRPSIYYPVTQTDHGYVSVMVLTVRMAGDPGSAYPLIRGVVADVDERTSLFRPLSGSAITRQASGQQRFSGIVITLFAITGVLLAAGGVFGMTAYTVGQRTPEFGLRMAVGARRRDIRFLVLREGLRLAAGGLVIGLGAALLAGWVLEDSLFRVGAFHGPTYGALIAVLGAVVVAASYFAAERATRVDPVTALRSE